MPCCFAICDIMLVLFFHFSLKSFLFVLAENQTNDPLATDLRAFYLYTVDKKKIPNQGNFKKEIPKVGCYFCIPLFILREYCLTHIVIIRLYKGWNRCIPPLYKQSTHRQAYSTCIRGRIHLVHTSNQSISITWILWEMMLLQTRWMLWEAMLLQTTDMNKEQAG